MHMHKSQGFTKDQEKDSRVTELEFLETAFWPSGEEEKEKEYSHPNLSLGLVPYRPLL